MSNLSENSKTKLPISLVIISLNEEERIGACIDSAPFVDEVILVDSGSTDKTCEIAQSRGAKVVFEKWRGYREQKIYAASLAKNKWILSLDADEALSPDLAAHIQNLFLSQNEMLDQFDGFEFSRLSYNLGRWIHHGGWFPDWQLRLYHSDRAKWTAGHVHERVQAERKFRLKESILHWPFQNLTEQIKTNNHYSSLGAQDLFERKIKFNIIKLLLKPISKFLETYIIKLGFLDGMAGFIISVGAAYSVFLKFSKLWELEKKHTNSQN